MELDILYRLNKSEIIKPIPPEYLPFFAPARVCLYEWQDYWLELPDADELRVGTISQGIRIQGTNLFRLRFENRLGLAEIQPYARARRVGQPLVVEVISGKFAAVDQHLSFFRSLLADLFRRAANLPFTISSPTAQNVTETHRPPTMLFMMHFINQHAQMLQESTEVVLANPHRLLTERVDKLPVFEASEVDGDVLVELLTDAKEWMPASGFTLAEALHGWAPQKVWQRIPDETWNTPENRFVCHFLKQVLSTADSLPAQNWWSDVAPDRRQKINETAGYLRNALQHPLFDEVGEMTRLPFESRVLMQREGYRQLLDLWHRFQQSRHPLFEQFQHAIELHDIAFMYEMWVFFRLVDEIKETLGRQPALNIAVSEKDGLTYQAEAVFESAGKLVFNQTFRRDHHPYHSYSLGLRPDFIWVEDGRPKIVFDAKFRLSIERTDSALLEAPDVRVESMSSQRIALQEDINKMHTYRDALGVQSAVILFPGNVAVFYDELRSRLDNVSLLEILKGDGSGVGALPLCPA